MALVKSDEAKAILRPGGQYKPEIRVEMVYGTPMLVKDYRPCGVLFRLLLGRWLVTREFEAYCAARGIPGVASCVRRLDPYALAIGYVHAQPCTQLDGHPLPEAFWAKLAHIVDSLHARHIAHGDLKTLGNILVADDGSVRLVDFSSAAFSRVDLVHLICYPHLFQDDQRAIVKAKLQLAAERVTEEELALWERRSAIERFFRWAREYVRPVIKRLGGRGARTAAMPPAETALGSAPPTGHRHPSRGEAAVRQAHRPE